MGFSQIKPIIQISKFVYWTKQDIRDKSIMLKQCRISDCTNIQYLNRLLNYICEFKNTFDNKAYSKINNTFDKKSCESQTIFK